MFVCLGPKLRVKVLCLGLPAQVGTSLTASQLEVQLCLYKHFLEGIILEEAAVLQGSDGADLTAQQAQPKEEAKPKRKKPRL